MDQRIVIYDGAGVSPSLRAAFLPLNPRFLTAEDLLKGAWESAEILIMPGGRDCPYHASLKGRGNERIRSFVEKGGRYVGLCAGAYYGCSKVVFDPGHPLEVCEGRELGFFSGAAVGPAYGFGTFDYRTQKGARAALLETEAGSFHAYYNGGCFFEGDLSGYKVLARYADLPGKPAAVIACSIGQGTAVLSGPHIETPATILSGVDPLLPLLLESENKRQEFWRIALN